MDPCSNLILNVVSEWTDDMHFINVILLKISIHIQAAWPIVLFKVAYMQWMAFNDIVTATTSVHMLALFNLTRWKIHSKQYTYYTLVIFHLFSSK